MLKYICLFLHLKCLFWVSIHQNLCAPDWNKIHFTNFYFKNCLFFNILPTNFHAPYLNCLEIILILHVFRHQKDWLSRSYFETLCNSKRSSKIKMIGFFYSFLMENFSWAVNFTSMIFFVPISQFDYQT